MTDSMTVARRDRKTDLDLHGRADKQQDRLKDRHKDKDRQMIIWTGGQTDMQTKHHNFPVISRQFPKIS